jgi:ATP phosphoribosyltransferase regulatory subunit
MTSNNQTRSFKPIIPQGVQCYFGREVYRRRRIEIALAATLGGWSYHEIILPFFDYLEDFTYGLGSQLGDKAYRFLDRDGSVLALRPDFTTMVAKTVATRMTDQPLPIRLFYSGAVFRQEKVRAGKQRELYQVGYESIGYSHAWTDVEVILLAIECLLNLNVTSFKIVIGHADFFNGLVSGLKLSPEKAEMLRDAMDHKDPAWLKKEVENLPLSSKKKEFLVDLPNYAGDRGILDQALSLVRNQRSRGALEALIKIRSVIEALGLDEYLTFDLAEVRDLDYYTGIVFKIYGDPVGCELGGGGRYDGLLEKFGWDVPAVGCEFTLDWLLHLVGEAETPKTPGENGPERILAAGGGDMEEVFQHAWDLRENGTQICIKRSM